MRKIIAALCSVFMLSTSFAEQVINIDEIIANDTKEKLQTIDTLSADLATKEMALTALEKELNDALIDAQKQKTGVALIGAGVIGFAVSAFAEATLRNIPVNDFGVALRTLFSTMFIRIVSVAGSGSVIVAGTVKYFINVNDAKELSESAKLLKGKIEKTQKSLNMEITYLCKSNNEHDLCK